MSPVDQALNVLLGWFRRVFEAFLSFFGLIEVFLRQTLTSLDIPARFQGIVILFVTILIIILIARLFAGLFRVFLILFLVLLILRVLSPLLGV